ncbi:hypothetical protein CMI37_22900 [Candidatus Pacearchaeota archaeon]|nr:hypothetical protein [Candidatus Pacearchaeota archaeon]|tara:strand:+ start:671 stop:970 length:300 start_codon:yes stop_codon:yes gene_type:complete
MTTEIVMVAPPHCRACQWKPVEPQKDNPGQEIAIENVWLIMPMPNSVIWIYICPACGFLHVNDNALENAIQLNEIKKNKIVTSGGTKIVTPLNNNIKLN